MRDEIVHIVPALFGRHGVFGGAERYALALARAMADVLPTRLVAFGERAANWTDGPLRIDVLEGIAVRGQPQNPFSTRLRRYVRAAIVHVHQPYTVMGTTVALARRALRRKVFATDLGGGGWDLSSYVRTDALFTGHLHISRYSQQLGRRQSASRVISGGVDTVKFYPSERPKRPRSIAYIGRILPHKGIDVLIRSLPERASLRIVGRVSDPEYLRYLHDLAAGKNVEFIQNAEDGELIETYQTSSCVALLSVHVDYRGRFSLVPELLGQTPLEAMACGTPAVVSDASSLPEVVEDGLTGFVVPQNDVNRTRAALSRILDDSDAQRRMGCAGRERVLERFAWGAVVQRCLRAYEELG